MGCTGLRVTETNQNPSLFYLLRSVPHLCLTKLHAHQAISPSWILAFALIGVKSKKYLDLRKGSESWLLALMLFKQVRLSLQPAGCSTRRARLIFLHTTPPIRVEVSPTWGSIAIK